MATDQISDGGAHSGGGSVQQADPLGELFLMTVGWHGNWERWEGPTVKNRYQYLLVSNEHLYSVIH